MIRFPSSSGEDERDCELNSHDSGNSFGTRGRDVDRADAIENTPPMTDA
jgi:hypothetical protein